MLEKLLTKEVVAPIFIVIIAVLAYLLIKKIIIKMFKASKKCGVHKKSMTIMNLVINLAKYFILIVALLTVLSVWGVDTKALIASLGVAGVVAGLALQDLFKDLLAGFSIIIDNEFDVGDNVKIGTFRGNVVELGMKNTKIRAYSGEVKSISNRASKKAAIPPFISQTPSPYNLPSFSVRLNGSVFHPSIYSTVSVCPKKPNVGLSPYLIIRFFPLYSVTNPFSFKILSKYLTML